MIEPINPHRIPRQAAMDICSVPARMLFAARIAVIEQLADQYRLAVRGDQTTTHAAKYSAATLRIVRNLGHSALTPRAAAPYLLSFNRISAMPKG
jgi:hypothetical protein